jgi:hypothetical protein
MLRVGFAEPSFDRFHEAFRKSSIICLLLECNLFQRVFLPYTGLTPPLFRVPMPGILRIILDFLFKVR